MTVSKKDPVIAIVGATGVIGSEVLSVLEERNTPCAELHLFASDESAGELYSFHGNELEVEALTPESFLGVNYAIFAVSDALAEQYIPAATEAGVVVVDSSNYSSSLAPVVVPAINEKLLTKNTRWASTSTAGASQLAPAIKALLELGDIRFVTVSGYQAVSSAGKQAMDELWEQTRSVFTQTSVETETFQHQIAFNCVPQTDTLLEDGYTIEERLISAQLKDLLELSDCGVSVTAVRVPVFHGDSQSVSIQFNNKVTREDALKALKASPALAISDHLDEFPLPIEVPTHDEIFIGRVRASDNAVHFWSVADNLRQGGALDSVQILENLIELQRKP